MAITCIGLGGVQPNTDHTADTRGMQVLWRFHVPSKLSLSAAELRRCVAQVPEAEYEETVNKAAALGRAIDLAEQAFLHSDSD